MSFAEDHDVGGFQGSTRAVVAPLCRIHMRCANLERHTAVHVGQQRRVCPTILLCSEESIAGTVTVIADFTPLIRRRHDPYVHEAAL